jgi:hypothetical protein
VFLTNYQQLRAPRREDPSLFRKVRLGLSWRDYPACADAVHAAFGLSRPTVSWRFIRASVRKLFAFLERRLDCSDLVALLLDGKIFAEDEIVMALGVTMTGEKALLGFVQMATENERVCAAFLRDLVERGLQTDPRLLCVLDGSNGLRKAIQMVFGSRQWSNAVSGTNWKAWWLTCRRGNRPLGAGRSSRPMSIPPTPRRRRLCSGAVRNSGLACRTP